MGVALLLIALCCLVGVAWWWTGQANSLASTLGRIASWMPADQKLEANGIEGSLRTGGRIGWLRWTSPAMQIEIKDADIEWRLQPLLSRELRLGRVNMAELRIRSTPQPKEDAPAAPLQSLQLPMRIDVPVRVERVVWEAPTETVITELYGHYNYNGIRHDLDVSSLRYAGGLYQAQMKLQAAAPMRLDAQVHGHIEAPLPNQPGKVLDIIAKAAVQGTLATEAAQLDISAQAQTQSSKGTDAVNADQALSADVKATVRPWRKQPLEQVHAQLHHMDAALFIPDGPHTDLNGTVQAGPDNERWKLQADLSNRTPGPWDQQALPVRSVQAQASFDGAQTWLLQSARVEFGKTGDAYLQAQGSWNAQTQAVEAQAELHAVNPSDLYSTLAAAPLSGTVQATTDAQQQVQFEMDFQATQSRSSPALRIETARAQGTWKSPVLELRNVYLDALQAKLQSQALQVHTETQHIEGKLQAQLPGTRAELDMRGGADAGQGALDLHIASAEQLSQWLSRLPLGADPLGGAKLQGSATAKVQWNGGWGKLQQRLQNPAAPVQASGLKLQANLTAPQLSYQPLGGSATQFQQVQLSLSGSPEALHTQLQAQARLGAQSVAVDTDLTAGLLVAKGAAPIDWQAKIAQLTATWSPNAQAHSAWKVQLTAPLSVNQHTTGNPVRTTRIQASAGSLNITPPANAQAQTASLQWEPLALRQAGNGTWGVQTKGRVHNVPLAWVDAFSPNPQAPLLASAGLGGDLIVQGYWDIDNTGRQMRADVLLERASGDIRLSVEDSDAAPVTVVRSAGASEVNTQTRQVQSRALVGTRGMRARLQDLRLQLGAQGNDLRAQLVWNSERAGQINADVRSQVRQANGGFVWPANAPISGTVKASMPNIGIWALFAPPGWRVGGTFNADVALSGTRSAPQWDGQLTAQQLSVLSLLDGVDLKNGRLRARLQGTRVDITELYLEGGEGSSTRILGPSGNLTSAPKDGGSLTGTGFVLYDPAAPEGSSGITMDIQATARQLQVLVRADRQLSVSGNLRAGMQSGQVTLRGDLKIDRAAIMLADESAPKLDDDVYVTSAASRQAAQAKAQKDAAQVQSGGSVQAVRPPDVQVQLDLGNDFALQGYGITTRLEGQLHIANGPRITGEIHTVNGRYRAWGQSLDVESGIIRFSGPYANPAIDITAIRPNIEVRAGVKVSGSANSPRVVLFSEPEMSDAEKLSWIVMGRSAAAGGAETALLQQAALALLSGGGGTGNFASNFGLDEIGLKGPSADGEQGAALTVGKRLSKDFYIAYEQSLNGAMGTLYIFYDLSKRLTLRGQTGEQTAIDLIYTKTKD